MQNVRSAALGAELRPGECSNCQASLRVVKVVQSKGLWNGLRYTGSPSVLYDLKCNSCGYGRTERHYRSKEGAAED